MYIQPLELDPEEARTLDSQEAIEEYNEDESEVVDYDGN